MNERHSPVALRFSNVSFAYGATQVLSQVDFHIHEGEFSALIGPNGTGKSTILKLALGLEVPSEGSVTLFGKEPQSAAQSIGYVPQNIQFDADFPITVTEVVGMGLLHPNRKTKLASRRDAIEAALESTSIQNLAQRSYNALSGGQRRRVLIARALVSQPRLLILDEPTANMDAQSEELFFQTLGSIKGQRTIFIVTHDTSFVSALTDVVFCLGERGSCNEGANIVRHLLEKTNDAPEHLFGGDALKVVHEVKLGGDDCLEKGAGNV